jgi:hypothetical protein
MIPEIKLQEGRIYYILQNCNKENKIQLVGEIFKLLGPILGIKFLQGEILGSHGGEYEDACLLGCCAV